MSKKSIVLISASPKIGEQSVSEFLTSMQAEVLQDADFDVHKIIVRNSITNKKTQEDFEIMLKADVFIITFPLYIFCLPGILIRFLQDYYDYWLKNKDESTPNKKVYTVINCGFPEPEINEEAARVIRSFSEKVGSIYRFALLIGGGGMLVGAKDAPFMKKTFDQINDAYKLMASDIISCDFGLIDNKYVSINFPGKLYLFMGNRGWFSWGRKNGLKKKDLYKRPY